MRVFLLVACSSALLGLKSKAPDTTASASSSVCMPMDGYANYHIANLRSIVTSTKPTAIAWRNNVHLPAVSDTAVAIVADSITCARGLVAYNAAIADTTVTSLYLIRVGSTTFVASNPKLKAGEFVQHFVFDSAFRLRSQYFKMSCGCDLIKQCPHTLAGRRFVDTRTRADTRR